METDSSVSLEGQLIEAINESLQNGVFCNASFLGERLVAERDCQEHRNILADCYFGQNKPNKAYHILKECKSETSRYKFSLACIRVNKLKEAEKALTSQDTGRTTSFRDAIPNGGYGHYLLGIINERQQKHQEAKTNFSKAVEMNPTIWVAYEKLVKMGDDVVPNRVFTVKKTSSLVSDPEIYGRRRVSQQAQTVTTKKKPNQKENIIGFLKKFADATYQMAMYRCEQAIAKYKELPSNHLNTGWVQFQIGKAYMELVRYSEAEKYFSQARKIEPYRLQGIEYYSSCLWHLKKFSDLVYLAQEACNQSIYAFETWITMGNCFSSFKEHDLALKFFTRAIQLNPYNPISYSLCAHEYVYNEDFNKAKKMFETSLAFDVRHYSAWWGLGNIAYKQEKYSKATEFFLKAVAINPQNPVIYSFLGMTASASNDYAQALSYFYKSQTLDNKNCLNKYQKANALVKLSKFTEAITELEHLHKMMPKEAPVLTLLGMIYKKLGKIDLAHNYLSKALDLECKDTQRIKGFIDNLESNEDENELLQ